MRLMYVQITFCFLRDVKQNLLNNNMMKVSNKSTKVRYEISPSLTMKRASLPQVLEVFCSHELNFNNFFT